MEQYPEKYYSFEEKLGIIYKEAEEKVEKKRLNAQKDVDQNHDDNQISIKKYANRSSQEKEIHRLKWLQRLESAQNVTTSVKLANQHLIENVTKTCATAIAKKREEVCSFALKKTEKMQSFQDSLQAEADAEYNQINVDLETARREAELEIEAVQKRIRSQALRKTARQWKKGKTTITKWGWMRIILAIVFKFAILIAGVCISQFWSPNFNNEPLILKIQNATQEKMEILSNDTCYFYDTFTSSPISKNCIKTMKAKCLNFKFYEPLKQICLCSANSRKV